jgi:LysM repeat protein
MRKTAVAIALVTALLGAGAAKVGASQKHPAQPAWTHVVTYGETLWGLAKQAAPGKDPRATVDLLISSNHLQGAGIRPGQRLVLPHR